MNDDEDSTGEKERKKKLAVENSVKQVLNRKLKKYKRKKKKRSESKEQLIKYITTTWQNDLGWARIGLKCVQLKQLIRWYIRLLDIWPKIWYVLCLISSPHPSTHLGPDRNTPLYPSSD